MGPKKSIDGKSVSLSNELHLLMDSLRGVHSLTKQWIASFGHDPLVPDQISALLTVLVERVRLIDRVVRGTVDPHLLWSRENDAALCPGDPAEEDVVVSTWSEPKPARRHRAASSRTKNRRPTTSDQKLKSTERGRRGKPLGAWS
jgi:hypothetical protein